MPNNGPKHLYIIDGPLYYYLWLIKAFSESEVAIGLSSGKVEVWRIEKGNNNRDVGVKVLTFEAHNSRIKGMAVCQGLLFTGDSSGLVCAFDKTGKKLLEQETKARITCLSVSVEMEENGNDQEMTEIKEETTTKSGSQSIKKP